MEQVANYCQQRGVPYAAVTNGHQIAIFVGSRTDGIPPLDGNAIVFESLPHMLNDFQKLWNVLSKHAIQAQTIGATLIYNGQPLLPPKLSATIRPYPGTKGRNPFQSSMKAVSELY